MDKGRAKRGPWVGGLDFGSLFGSFESEAEDARQRMQKRVEAVGGRAASGDGFEQKVALGSEWAVAGGVREEI